MSQTQFLVVTGIFSSKIRHLSCHSNCLLCALKKPQETVVLKGKWENERNLGFWTSVPNETWILRTQELQVNVNEPSVSSLAKTLCSLQRMSIIITGQSSPHQHSTVSHARRWHRTTALVMLLRGHQNHALGWLNTANSMFPSQTSFILFILAINAHAKHRKLSWDINYGTCSGDSGYAPGKH